MKEHEKTIVDRLNKYADAVKAGNVGPSLSRRKVVLKFPAVELDAAAVQTVRKQIEVSQTVFASLLGVSTNTVQAWEQGVNVPSLMASRFMDAIRSDPEYWKAKLFRISGVVESTSPGKKPSRSQTKVSKKSPSKATSVRRAKA
jgi:putative transcriptional regulator